MPILRLRCFLYVLLILSQTVPGIDQVWGINDDEAADSLVTLATSSADAVTSDATASDQAAADATTTDVFPSTVATVESVAPDASAGGAPATDPPPTEQPSSVPPDPTPTWSFNGKQIRTPSGTSNETNGTSEGANTTATAGPTAKPTFLKHKSNQTSNGHSKQTSGSGSSHGGEVTFSSLETNEEKQVLQEFVTPDSKEPIFETTVAPSSEPTKETAPPQPKKSRRKSDDPAREAANGATRNGSEGSPLDVLSADSYLAIGGFVVGAAVIITLFAVINRRKHDLVDDGLLHFGMDELDYCDSISVADSTFGGVNHSVCGTLFEESECGTLYEDSECQPEPSRSSIEYRESKSMSDDESAVSEGLSSVMEGSDTQSDRSFRNTRDTNLDSWASFSAYDDEHGSNRGTAIAITRGSSRTTTSEKCGGSGVFKARGSLSELETGSNIE